MNKQLTAKAPRYMFVCFFHKKKHPHQFDWYTKNRNDQAFMWICSLLRADKSLNSEEFHSWDKKSSLYSLLFFFFFFCHSLPLGDQLLGLQLHLCSPFEGNIHQELEAAEVLCEVWRGGGRGVEEPAAGAQVALHAGAADDGGSGGERLAAWPFIPAPEQHLCSVKQLSCPVTVHSWHRGVGGCRAGLHCCGDSGVTDDRRAGGHEPWRRGNGGWRGYGGRHRLPQDAGYGGLEAGGVENAFVIALLRTCCRAAVFRGLGAVREAVASLATFPGYGELVGIFAIFPQHLWKKPPPRVNEPVAHLQTNKKIRAVRKAHHMAHLCSASQENLLVLLITRCSLHLCFQ